MSDRIKLHYRQILLVLSDAFFIYVCGIVSVMVASDFQNMAPLQRIYSQYALPVVLLTLLVLVIFGAYSSIWTYASGEEFLRISLAIATSQSILLLATTIHSIELPVSFIIIHAFLCLGFIAGVRLSYRFIRNIKSFIRVKTNCQLQKRTLIVGAGNAGTQIIREMQSSKDMNRIPVGIIDDNPSKKNLTINGVKVFGNTSDIPSLVKTLEIKEIIIAIPSASQVDKSVVVDICNKTGIATRILPGLSDLIDGRVSIGASREIDIKDLLQRDEISIDALPGANLIKGKTVMVTGGGGSIGSELCRQIMKNDPKELIIIDIYENNAYDIQNELKFKYDPAKIKVFIGSVRDTNRLEYIFYRYKPNIVFHAAAHKHVPLMEDSPSEAIKNNVFGTLNLAQAADKHGVEKFILISTDKAVNPTNIMGASKRLAEMIIQSFSNKSNTEFAAVRFGNVLGSNGSVIPLFQNQISKGGPITVTHPDIIRYFMTIPEAVQLVIKAGAIAHGGEIFILDMGKPVKIVTLAEDLIRLSGFEPHRDIKIVYTGLRPGEKLFEELLMAEEGLQKTRSNKIFVANPMAIDEKELFKNLAMLKHIIETSDNESIRHMMTTMVDTYQTGESRSVIREEMKEVVQMKNAN